MKRKVIPTVFSKNNRDFYIRLNILKKISKNIHIDFMDGKFVKVKSIELKEINKLDNKFYEAHLMLYEPYKYLEKLKKKGFKKIIFHYETCDNLEVDKTIRLARRLGFIVFIAVNPETSINSVIPFLNKIDGVLIMGVYPGKEGQKFIFKTYGKIAELRQIDKNIIIQVDGGLDLKNVKLLRKAEVNIINTGSFVSKSENPKNALIDLEEAFN